MDLDGAGRHRKRGNVIDHEETAYRAARADPPARGILGPGDRRLVSGSSRSAALPSLNTHAGETLVVTVGCGRGRPGRLERGMFN